MRYARLAMVMRAPASARLWVVDPEDPRAPPDEIWDAMTPRERRRVVDSLPSEFPVKEAMPPEGDPHFNAKVDTRVVLGAHFTRTHRRVYIACELPVYYPAEAMFAPDILAVTDVELKERMSWIVRQEGKGLDFALEIVVSGSRRKDLEVNVERYARLGISEYFVFDRGRLELLGYRLHPRASRAASGRRPPAAAERAYRPLLARDGLYSSEVLGLDLTIEGTKLRFYHMGAPVLEAAEQISKLERMVGDVEQRLLAAEERADAEARLRVEAQARVAELEKKLSEASAKIARLTAERAATAGRSKKR